MKTEIKNNSNLLTFLKSLTPEQLQQSPKIICEVNSGQTIVSAETSEEPFLQSKLHNDVAGYESEMRKEYGDDFAIEDFTILEPVGTVIYYAE